MNGIPIFYSNSEGDTPWETYFRKTLEEKGDSEAANGYISVKNFRFLRENVLRLIGDVRGLTILDIGCGTGHFSQSLAGENYLLGIDISSEMLSLARNKGLHAIQSSGDNLPIPDKSFDMALSVNVIQTIPRGKELIREMMRVIKPGGRAVVSTINGGNITLAFFRAVEKKKYERMHIYTPEELIGCFIAHDGRVNSVLFLYFPFGKAKKMKRERDFGFSAKYFSTSFTVEAVRPMSLLGKKLQGKRPWSTC